MSNREKAIDSAGRKFFIPADQIRNAAFYTGLHEEFFSELGSDDRIRFLEFREVGNGIYLCIHTTRHTMYRSPAKLELTNALKVIHQEVAHWKSLAAMFDALEKKPQFKGYFVPEGRMISFNKLYGAHEFSEKECQKLLAGEVISFTATTKYGNLTKFTGKLTQQEYNNFLYYGFEAIRTEVIPTR